MPILISLIFFNYVMPLSILLIGLLVVVLFFYGLNYYSMKWSSLDFQQIESRLFILSFVIRFLFMFYLYFLTYFLAPDSFPFEPGAMDSWTYHNVALKLSDSSFNLWNDILAMNMKSRSDYGYPFYQGLIYSFFGSYTIIVRIVNCFLGAWTIVLIGRIVKLSWGEDHAKMAAIIGMLFPTLVWFCGIQLKETLMVFMVVSAFYLIWEIRARNSFSTSSMLMALFCCFSLFFFRTFLAVLVLISVFMMFIPVKRDGGSRIILLMGSLVFVYLIYSFVISLGIFEDVNRQLVESDGYFSRNLEQEKDLIGDIKFDQVALAPLIVGGAILTPFPSYLNTEERQLTIYSRFQNDLVRNMMYFFFYIGVYFTIKNRLREYASIIFFTVAYLAVITSAANSFQARFHMPILPFIIIFIGVGVVEVKRKVNKAWSIYLVGIFIAQLMWAYFKLNIRGLYG